MAWSYDRQVLETLRNFECCTCQCQWFTTLAAESAQSCCYSFVTSLCSYPIIISQQTVATYCQCFARVSHFPLRGVCFCCSLTARIGLDEAWKLIPLLKSSDKLIPFWICGKSFYKLDLVCVVFFLLAVSLCWAHWPCRGHWGSRTNLCFSQQRAKWWFKRAKSQRD